MPPRKPSTKRHASARDGVAVAGDVHCADFVGRDQHVTYGYSADDVERLIERVLTFLQAGAAFVPYRIESEEDVPAFAPVGGEHKVTATGSAHNERGQLRKNDPETLRQLRHLRSKVEARAAAMEAHTDHPLARAITEHARAEGVRAEAAEEYRVLPGRGAEGVLGSRRFWIGSHRLMRERAALNHTVGAQRAVPSFFYKIILLTRQTTSYFY